MQQKQISTQTSAILFKEPTSAEMRPSRRAIILVNIKESALFAALSFLLWCVAFTSFTFVSGN